MKCKYKELFGLGNEGIERLRDGKIWRWVLQIYFM